MVHILLRLIPFLTLICISNGFLSPILSLSHTDIRRAVEINIRFTTEWIIEQDEVLVVSLPRFTTSTSTTSSTAAGNNIAFGQLKLSPSTIFAGSWVEGNVKEVSPFASSKLLVKLLPNVVVTERIYSVNITVYADNGISIFCGFPDAYTVSLRKMSSVVNLFYITSTFNSIRSRAADVSSTTAFVEYPMIGTGCQDFGNCNDNGECDYCLQKCKCYSGFGSDSDIVVVGSDLDLTCRRKTCPFGKAVTDVPSAFNKAHELAECSNFGKCDRSTGICNCFNPFGGSACDRMLCPNECSGHGTCLTMSEISSLKEGQPTRRDNAVYGTASAIESVAWDYNLFSGCICESSWTVGFGSGERQLGEYFGADCSMRRCPTGDDPFTHLDETNCHGKNQLSNNKDGGNFGTVGNICHIDCSNRGICDYKTGTCSCFPGSWGDNCQQRYISG